MGVFDDFSRRPKADSEALPKCDSRADLLAAKVAISAFGRRPRGIVEWADANRRARLSGVAPPRDAAGIDVENFARCAEFGERQGVGAGHPDLRAEFCQFSEQGVAPCGIEMGYHLVEQQ